MTSGGHLLPGKLLSENDPAFGQVVRRHFHMDPISDNGADAETSHLAGRVGDDPMLIIEHHTEPTVR
jgi:hypothetical protein